MEFRVWGVLGFRVWGSGFGGLGFVCVCFLGFRVWGLGVTIACHYVQPVEIRIHTVPQHTPECLG